MSKSDFVNPLDLERDAALRQARLQSAPPSSLNLTVADAGSGLNVGENDPVTGDYLPYGLVNITDIHDGFRAARQSQG